MGYNNIEYKNYLITELIKSEIIEVHKFLILKPPTQEYLEFLNSRTNQIIDKYKGLFDTKYEIDCSNKFADNKKTSTVHFNPIVQIAKSINSDIEEKEYFIVDFFAET